MMNMDLDSIFWIVLMCQIDLKTGVLGGQEKHVNVDSTWGLSWRGGIRGQDKFFEMLDHFDRSS